MSTKDSDSGEMTEKLDETNDLLRNKNEESDLDFSTKTWKEDLTLIVGDKQLFVSKHVLALASPVFSRMFESGFKENGQDEISMPGKEYKDVSEFLRCIYPNMCKQVTRENVLQVLPLAEEYQVQHLKERCEVYLIGIVNDATTTCDLFRYVIQAATYNLKELEAKSIDLAVDKTEDELSSADEQFPIPSDVKSKVYTKLSSKLFRKLKTSADTIMDLEARLKYLTMEPTSTNTSVLKKFEDAKGTSLTFTLGDISTLSTLSTQESEIVNHVGCGWAIVAKTVTYFPFQPSVMTKTSLGIFLKCYPPKTVRDWSCEVTAQLVLVNGFSWKQHKSVRISHVFDAKSTDQGNDKLIDFEDLKTESNGFVTKGKVTCVAYMLVQPPTFKTA